MRSRHINGKINLTGMYPAEEGFVFTWEDIEWWTEEGNPEAFLGGPRAFTVLEELPMEMAELVIWNRRRKKTLPLLIDTEQLADKKIVVLNWDEVMDRFRRKTSRQDMYWVLRGFKDEMPVHLILGGHGDLGGVFTSEEVSRRLAEDDLDLNLIPRYIEPDRWVLRGANGKQFIDQAVKDGMMDRYLLDTEAILWQEHGMWLQLTESARETLSDGTVSEYLIYNERDGRFFRGKLEYDPEANQLKIGYDFENHLLDAYNDIQAGFSFRVFPVELEIGRTVIYECRTADEAFKETRKAIADRMEDFTELGLSDSDDPEMIVAMPYYTKGGYLKFVLRERSRIFNVIAEANMKEFYIRKGVIYIRFTLRKSKFSLKCVQLILRSSVKDKRYDFDLTIEEKERRFVVEGRLAVADVEWEQFYWDIRGTMTKDGVDCDLHIRSHSRKKRFRMLLQDRQVVLPGGQYLIYSYVTKSRDFAIAYRARTPQDRRSFVWKEYLALFLYYLLRPYWLHKNIWLVYEKYSITAQDNSLYFFKYCMEKLPPEEKKHIYYVIDKKASDYQYVQQYGKKVIQFLSLKHMIYLKAAALLISSDTKAHAYAWHSPQSLYRHMMRRNRNVFLQHGVIYYKKCHQGLRKRSSNPCKLFIVSSDVEKQIILDYFGYKEKEIAVTGLARWDVLEDKSVPGEKMILIMPTWRSWLEEVTEEEFRKSDYYKKYMELLNAPMLHDFLERKQVKLVFYIHPKFREYISAFAVESPRIEMIEFGTQPLNQLLMRCNMMITDYSSACWDVYYQGKPVLFYLFDFELYNQVQGSYVDMRTEAFGESTDQMEELIRKMEEYEENGFREKEKYAAMREELLPYRDHNNCERTYECIMNRFYRKKQDDEFDEEDVFGESMEENSEELPGIAVGENPGDLPTESEEE